MTDRELATVLVETTHLERRARAYWDGLDRDDQAERDAALVTVRHATALKRGLEQWITARACRAALTQ